MRRLLLSMLVLVPFVYAACSSPAGPPAPPVEMPSPVVLKFVEPEDMRLSLGGLAAPIDAATSVYRAIGDDRSTEIRLGPEMVREFDREDFFPILQGISEIEIPVDESVTTFRVTQVFSTTTGFLRGENQVKIDFADFDFDNDGATEGCSGHTAALPICARMWVDGTRYLAWVFEEYPVSPETADVAATMIGAGRFKAYGEDAEGIVGGEPLMLPHAVAVHYDHRDAANKVTDAYAVVPLVDDPPDFMAAHVIQTQEGPDANFIETISFNRTYDFTTLAGTRGRMDYLGRFAVDAVADALLGDFWSGSFFVDDALASSVLENFTDECVQVSSGISVEQSNCEALGIRVFDEPFTDTATNADVDLPDDFPLLPTF